MTAVIYPFPVRREPHLKVRISRDGQVSLPNGQPLTSVSVDSSLVPLFGSKTELFFLATYRGGFLTLYNNIPPSEFKC